MIKLTGLNHKEVIINSIAIEKIEEVPETVITLLNGNKYLVEESPDEVIDKIIAFKKRINDTKYL
ncbi:flagellar protein FlbD [Clostridium acidisoli DSM 12555]|uniref:Flagellar protein FlbD n=1 Tax=Clostridium acidisoli DSM 12555 TaxID=1121291 RepID=A0A1W1X1K2_9CLOT|nr:flagellar FlbD family protein [Clostridium acidisoli]SMC17846.1 flagellar protein FlbD [Clostridium acidisoli DSM 12555]